ncbi:hypothetical protein EDB19DRAFT_1833581 [Suillus lakei]|nr:hypothetical protein EDB19DRAFT_1833581 [Suillus lakei]
MWLLGLKNRRLQVPTCKEAGTKLCLSSKEAAFFKTQIGIDNDEEAYSGSSIESIQELCALKYRNVTAPRLDISTFPVYEHVLKLGRERPDAVLLDIGCYFGVDARKAAADGFPVEHIIASDINKAFLRVTEWSDDISSAPGIDLTSLKSLNSTTAEAATTGDDASNEDDKYEDPCRIIGDFCNVTHLDLAHRDTHLDGADAVYRSKYN